jgi:hypothetical protein
MTPFWDEKIVGILSIATIAIVSLFRLAEPSNIVIPCVTGIAGFVTGVAVEAVRKPLSPPSHPLK